MRHYRTRRTIRPAIPTSMKRNHAESYNSLTEFYADISLSNKAYLFRPEREDFTGATVAEAEETRYAWHEPFERHEPELIRDSTRRVKRWSEYDGQDMDMQRFYDGRPCLVKREKVFDNADRTQARVERINCDIAVSCGISTREIENRARKYMADIDKAEASGQRVEVYAVMYVSSMDIGGVHNAEFQIRLKAANEPLQMERIAAALAPWFYRIWCFAWMDKQAEKHGFKMDHSTYGTPRPWSVNTQQSKTGFEHFYGGTRTE